jgi:hypothetical protein
MTAQYYGCVKEIILSVRKSGFYCEAQISKTKYIEICKSNNPAISGGYNTPPLGVELGSRACPGIYSLDFLLPITNKTSTLEKMQDFNPSSRV